VGAPYGRDAGERYRECAVYINASGQHLLRLVNDILDLSKLAAGQLELAESLVDVAAVVRECIELMQTQAQQKSLALSTDVAEGLPRRAPTSAVISPPRTRYLRMGMPWRGNGGKAELSAPFLAGLPGIGESHGYILSPLPHRRNGAC